MKLAEKLDAGVARLNKRLAVLIEINVGGEAAKSGLAPDSRELEELLHGCATVRGVRISRADDCPAVHRRSRRRHGLSFGNCASCVIPSMHAGSPQSSLRVLSMGMSHDFEVAIAEGSTCVRVGTAIFGERTKTL